MRVSVFLETMAYVVAAAVSVLIGEVLNYSLTVAVPDLRAPIGLFHMYSETVGIDVYGAFFPLFLSIGLFFMLRKSKKLKELRPCGGPRFWLSVGLVGAVFVALFAYLRLGVGTFSLTHSEAVFIVPLSGLFGVLYAVWRRRSASLAGLEAYIIGVFGVFLSDLFLSLSGISQAPGKAIVWGGSGTHDLVLWLGLYLAIPAFCFCLISPKLVLFFRSLGSFDNFP